MMENTKKPAIRFKGYTEAWEQRKLGDLVERVVRKNTNNECSLPLTISAQDGLVDQITYFNNRVASRDVSNYYLVLNGEFAYNKSTSDGFPFGAVKRLDLYKKGVLSTLYIVFGIKDNKEVNSDFLTVFFDTDRWHKGVAERAAEGARNHGLLNISAEDFFDIDLYLPKQEAEQTHIGAYMKRLDNLITLHQRKCDRLQNVKKSMLEKMFPKSGSKFPEIRFKGFTEAWEQRKLGEMYDRVSEKNDLSYTKEQIISVANMYFKPDSYITDEEYLRTYNVFLLGDIAFEGNKSKNYAHGRFVENTIGNGIVSHVFDVFRPKIDFDLLYWKYAINNERIMGDLLVRCTKASTMMTNLVAADFLKESLLVPSVEEQKKIGQYLTQLDNLITLHQRKLEKLRNIKKSMLEKMFV